MTPADTTASRVLEGSALFRSLPADAKGRLASSLRREEYEAGATVIRKGEPGDAVFIIDEGEAEVIEPATLKAGGGQQPDVAVAHLGPGDVFGEMAVLLETPRGHTVRATTPLAVYTLEGASLLGAVAADPAFGAAVREEILLRQVSNSLADGSPFAKLDQGGLRWIAHRLRPEQIPAGETVVRNGDPGDSMFIVRKGTLEVVDERPDGTEVRLATLGPGEPFGERALLTGEPRSASVRTLEPVELLRLEKPDFDQVLSSHPDRRGYFTELMMMRERPRRIEHWILEPQEHSGVTIYVLKDTDNIRYLRLSEAGAFVWGLLDGGHSIRDIALAYLHRFHQFRLDIVLETVRQLHGSGFVKLAEPKRGVPAPVEPSRVRSLGRKLLALPVHYFALPDADRAITSIYRHGLWMLFTPPVQVLLLLLSLAGLADFLVVRPQLTRPTGMAIATVVGLTALALYAQVILHELGHAVTCKHYGREVHRAGIGWYYFLVVAFVDTSDIWLSPRRARILVSAAGPYVNFVLAGIAMLLANAVPDPAWHLVLAQVTLTGYALAVVNLNPLIETDGYYVLMDWIDIANFRENAMRYLNTVIRRGRPDVPTATARLYLLFGVLAIAYTVLIAVSVVLGYRNLLSGGMAAIAPAVVAAAAGWVLAGVAASLVLARLAAELLTSGRSRPML